MFVILILTAAPKIGIIKPVSYLNVYHVDLKRRAPKVYITNTVSYLDVDHIDLNRRPRRTL